jgi:hypothetical protein
MNGLSSDPTLAPTARTAQACYDCSYKAVYGWNTIVQAASHHCLMKRSLKHLVYSAGWKKFERAWDMVIRIKQLSQMRPLLETILSPCHPKSTERQPILRESEPIRTDLLYRDRWGCFCPANQSTSPNLPPPVTY